MSDQVAVTHKFDKMVQESWHFQVEHHQRAEKAWDFHDGVQWTALEAQELSDRGQCASVINLCVPTINGLAAIEHQRRTDYIVVDIESGDIDTANVLTSLLSNVFKQCDFNFFLSKGFREGNIAGIDWFEVYKEEDIDTGRNLIKVAKRHFSEFYYDPFAKRPDKLDARYISREVWMDLDVAKETWPDKAIDLEGSFQYGRSTGFDGQEEEAQSSTTYNYVQGKARRIAIHDMYYRDAKKKVHFVQFTGNVFLHGSEEGENPSPLAFNYIP